MKTRSIPSEMKSQSSMLTHGKALYLEIHKSDKILPWPLVLKDYLYPAILESGKLSIIHMDFQRGNENYKKLFKSPLSTVPISPLFKHKSLRKKVLQRNSLIFCVSRPGTTP